jgi:hypothetical protein
MQAPGRNTAATRIARPRSAIDRPAGWMMPITIRGFPLALSLTGAPSSGKQQAAASAGHHQDLGKLRLNSPAGGYR